jgi:hypothetical protein
MERRRVATTLCLGILGAALGACGGAKATTGPGGSASSSGSATTTGSTSGSTGGGGGAGSTTSTSGSSSSSTGGSSSSGMLETGSICPHVAPGDHEQYGLPPTTGLPSGVTSLTDWTQHPAHGGWYGAQQMDDCRYQADPGGFMTWHGKLAARVEVDPGDDPLALGENSERTECLTEQDASGNQLDEGPASGAQFYATSYYFSTDWAATSYPYSVFEAGGGTWPGNVSSDCGSAGNLCNSWSLVLQFHQPGGGTPWAVLSAASPAPGQPQKMWLAGSQDVQFSDGGAIVPGKWVDLVLEVDWTSGAIDVWRRDEGQAGFTQVVATTFPAPVDGTYMKQGLYRGGNVNGRTDVLWVGPTARGSTFSAVEEAAFGTDAGP